MEYDEPEEIVAANNAAFQKLMLELGHEKSWLIAGQLSQAYKTGRSRGRSEIPLAMIS